MKAFSCVLLFATASLHAATFITVNCAPPSGVPVLTAGTETTSACYSSNPGDPHSLSGSTSAQGIVTLQLASNSADWSTLSTFQGAAAVQGLPRDPNSTIGPSALSSVSVSYSQSLITTGDIRPGYLQIQGGGSGGYFYDGSAAMTSGFTISPYTGRYDGAPVTEIYCEANSSSCSPGPGYYGFYNYIPVFLGTPLTLVADGHLVNQAVFQDGVSGGSLTTSFQFRFLEADQLTPVSVTAAPEPSTAAMLAMAAAGLAIYRSRLRTKGQSPNESPSD